MVDFVIKNIFERKGRLVVEVEVGDVLESFAFPLSYKKEVNGDSLWLSCIKDSLERRYDVEKNKSRVVYGSKKYLNKKFSTEDIEDMSPEFLRLKQRKKHLEFVDMNAEKIAERKKYKDGYPKEEIKILEKARTLKHGECEKCSIEKP